MSKQATLKQESTFLHTTNRRFREAIAIFFTVIAIYCIVALTGYIPDDPGWTHTGLNDNPKNAAGLLGAWFADIALYLLGYLAFLIPGGLLYTAVSMFRDWKASWGRGFLLIRLFGFIGALASSCVIASLYFVADWHPDVRAGGVLGDWLMQQGLPVFNVLGTALLAIGALLISFTLATGLSWIAIADWLGKSLWNFGSRILQLLLQQKREQSETEALNTQNEKVKAKTKTAKEKQPPVETQRTEAAESSSEAVVTPEKTKTSWLQRFKRSKPKGEAKASQGTEPKFQEPDIDLAGMEQLTALDPVEVVSSAGQGNVYIPDAFIEPTPTPAAKPTLAQPVTPSSTSVAPKKVVEPSVTTPEPQQTPVATTTEMIPDDEPPLTEQETSFAKDQLLPNENYKKHQKAVKKVKIGGIPSLALLDPPQEMKTGISEQDLENNARLVEAKLAEFGIKASVEEVHPGPVVTRFEMDLAPGTKVSKVTALSKDLARALSIASVRVVEIIPGKSLIGLEIPNENREVVRLSEVLIDKGFLEAPSPLTMGLGKDIAGKPVCANLAKMPHLLVAGTTGAGKSVGLNCMLISLLYKATPEQLRLIMIDPKMLELNIYEGIPHLLAPVVTDMKEAANALRWSVGEMERRYRVMAQLGVRNVAGFNKKIQEAAARGEAIKDPTWKPEEGSFATEHPVLEEMPFIVVVIDEFADMMMIVGKKVEELIARIAQKARAAGIHLILATQRPSVDVITGLIKANVPTRIAFQVSTKIDSRTILDQGGAEALLGMGDMLYLPPGTALPIRVHGAFVDDHEVHKVVEDWKTRGQPDYLEEILQGGSEDVPGIPAEGAAATEDTDPLYDQVVEFVTTSRKVSISLVQRKFRIGYNRAARLVEELESTGVVSPAESNGNREVLAPAPASFD